MLSQKVLVCHENKCVEATASFTREIPHFLIDEDFVLRNFGNYERYEKPRKINVNGRIIEILGNFEVYLKMNDCELFPTLARVVKGLKFDVIVGNSYMHENDIVIDERQKRAYPRTCPPVLQLI